MELPFFIFLIFKSISILSRQIVKNKTATPCFIFFNLLTISLASWDSRQIIKIYLMFQKNSSSILIFSIILLIAKGGTLTEKYVLHGKTQWKWCFWSFLSGNLGGGSKLETINFCFFNSFCFNDLIFLTHFDCFLRLSPND